MTNLLDETKAAIKASGHRISDVVFIGSQSSGHRCTWPEFKRLANHNYHKGFGSQEVATDLIIAFSDGTMLTRGEYDGSEWWDYTPTFKPPTERKKITSVFSAHPDAGGWNTLSEINQ